MRILDTLRGYKRENIGCAHLKEPVENRARWAQHPFGFTLQRQPLCKPLVTGWLILFGGSSSQHSTGCLGSSTLLMRAWNRKVSIPAASGE